MMSSIDDTPAAPGSRIGVALSGGGHRASMFGLGVLLYLADAGVNRNVDSVASVSGGSITNAMMARKLDFSRCSADEFVAQVATPLAGQIARRGTLFAFWGTKLYLAAMVLSIGIVASLPWVLPAGGLRKTLAVLLGVVWCAWLAGRRGNVCGAAYDRTLLSGTRLAEVQRDATSVICATDLRTARQVYFAPRFIYGYKLGWTEPGGIRLSKAVQASASFPGGFPPARISTRKLAFKNTLTGETIDSPGQLVLLDGGLYDNMADQWVRGFGERSARWPWLAAQYGEPDTLIVVNSAERRAWRPFRSRAPVWGEIEALLRAMNVLYDNTTGVRRQDLVGRFDRAELEGEGLRGGFVMIQQSPYTVAGYYADEKQAAAWPARHARARQVLGALTEGPDFWRAVATRNAAVPTTLRALGIATCASLVRHAYVLAMCNLHVLLGYPLLSVPDETWFEALARGVAAEARPSTDASEGGEAPIGEA